ncbi:hypothetical protein DSM43518_00478 [Mycobacterium marinum]|uniref:Uncharacterized protein n=1 Tax=Mycobacterium marinum TaxID=1781 RepID=A0A3E2MUS1_MYCMR|nr:hypothetical protein DE4381_00001 [Mycobacterium marinum]RFZ15140.1 hypothetical protein DSM43518_00478 [Mycobacterium marinum]RFZ18373.1 hypothetical protein DSM43519_04191 [Mycobacterium marinum]RFZ18977.1 hypothetical protein VIMS_01308 [Mycobacterium marinum]RFZ23593.1 hypothetical protein DSM44344_03092 [Mycobacterium marinum]
MLVEHVQVGLDRGCVDTCHPCVAVVGIARGCVSTDLAHSQRQHQTTVTGDLDVRVRTDGLEAGIQQSRMNRVGTLL